MKVEPDKDRIYRESLLVIKMYWPHRYTSHGRTTIRRAIAQARRMKL